MNGKAKSTLFWTIVFALGAVAAWLLQQANPGQEGMSLRPAQMTLRPGETGVIELVNREANLVAVALKLRFDPSIVEIADSAPTRSSVLDGGDILDMGVRRSPGLLEILGTAVIGGRVLEPLAPVHRFTVRARAAGSSVLTVDDLRVVDRHTAERSLIAPIAHITVRPE